MTETEKPAFVALLSSVMDFYRRDVSEFAIGVWWGACASFDFEQVRKAFDGHAADPDRGQFAPMPADLVRVLRGTKTDRSLIAWGKVLDAIRRVGPYQDVAFDDAAIHAAIEDMGGWTKVCREPENDMPFVQKRFCESHRAYTARPDIGYPAVLAGEHSVSNAARGYATAPPMLVGDAGQARLVIEHAAGRSKVAITASTAVVKNMIRWEGNKR